MFSPLLGFKLKVPAREADNIPICHWYYGGGFINIRQNSIRSTSFDQLGTIGSITYLDQPVIVIFFYHYINTLNLSLIDNYGNEPKSAPIKRTLIKRRSIDRRSTMSLARSITAYFSPKTRYLNSGPLNDRTIFNHPNNRLVWYSDFYHICKFQVLGLEVLSSFLLNSKVPKMLFPLLR